MPCAFRFSAPADATGCIIIDGADCWRSAREAGRPAQPALYRMLEPYGYGLLAPVLDGLMSIYEGWLGERSEVDTPALHDTLRLLALLQRGSVRTTDGGAAGLGEAMTVALRSTRIMMAKIMGWDERDVSSETQAMFFGAFADALPHDRESLLQ